MRVLHEPKLDTVLMVEKTLIDLDEHPTRMELWRGLPRKVQYQTFKRILDLLEAHGQIIFNDKKIIYTGAKNEKLLNLIKSSIRIG